MGGSSLARCGFRINLIQNETNIQRVQPLHCPPPPVLCCVGACPHCPTSSAVPAPFHRNLRRLSDCPKAFFCGSTQAHFTGAMADGGKLDLCQERVPGRRCGACPSQGFPLMCGTKNHKSPQIPDFLKITSGNFIFIFIFLSFYRCPFICSLENVFFEF